MCRSTRGLFRRDPQLADQIESDARYLPKTSTSILPVQCWAGLNLRQLNRAQYKANMSKKKEFLLSILHVSMIRQGPWLVRTGPTIRKGVKRLFILENFNEYFDAEREAIFSAAQRNRFVLVGRTSIELDSKMSSKIATVELICKEIWIRKATSTPS